VGHICIAANLFHEQLMRGIGFTGGHESGIGFGAGGQIVSGLAFHQRTQMMV
jgi:hypothetical protein